MIVFVYGNGSDYDDEKAGKRVLVPASFHLLLDECTSKLNLPRAARRVFFADDGTEVSDLSLLTAKTRLAVSTGASFREANYQSKKARARRRSSGGSGGGGGGSRRSSIGSRRSSVGSNRSRRSNRGAEDLDSGLARPSTAPVAANGQGPLDASLGGGGGGGGGGADGSIGAASFMSDDSAAQAVAEEARALQDKKARIRERVRARQALLEAGGQAGAATPGSRRAQTAAALRRGDYFSASAMNLTEMAAAAPHGDGLAGTAASGPVDTPLGGRLPLRRTLSQPNVGDGAETSSPVPPPEATVASPIGSLGPRSVRNVSSRRDGEGGSPAPSPAPSARSVSSARSARSARSAQSPSGSTTAWRGRRGGGGGGGGNGGELNQAEPVRDGREEGDVGDWGVSQAAVGRAGGGAVRLSKDDLKRLRETREAQAAAQAAAGEADAEASAGPYDSPSGDQESPDTPAQGPRASGRRPPRRGPGSLAATDGTSTQGRLSPATKDAVTRRRREAKRRSRSRSRKRSGSDGRTASGSAPPASAPTVPLAAVAAENQPRKVPTSSSDLVTVSNVAPRVAGATLVLSGIPPSVERRALVLAAMRYGKVASLDFLRGRGVAYVDFADVRNAHAALDKLFRDPMVLDSARVAVDGTGLAPISANGDGAGGDDDADGLPTPSEVIASKFLDHVRTDDLEFEGLLRDAFRAAWKGMPAPLRAFVDERVMAERSQSQEWMWSVLDECAEQGVFPQANEATLRFLDIVDDRINEAVSKFRTTTAFGSHVRPRLALVGPRRSGKTTMAYLAVKALVFDYVAAETWDSTFVFVVNWARLLAHASSETATFYTRFVALAIRQLKAQRPSLAEAMPDLETYLGGMMAKTVPRLGPALEAAAGRAASALRLYGTKLHRAWADLPSDGGYAFLSLTARLPVVLADVLGFGDVVFVYDAFDAAVTLLHGSATGVPDAGRPLSDLLKVPLMSYPCILAACNSVPFYAALGGNSGFSDTNVLATLELVYTYDLVSEDTFLARYGDYDVAFIVRDADGRDFEVCVEDMGGCPAYIHEFLTVADGTFLPGADTEAVTIVDDERSNAYSARLSRLIQILTYGQSAAEAAYV